MKEISEEKKVLLQQIEVIHHSMREYFIISGISEENYDKLLLKLINKTESELEFLKNKLLELKGTSFQSYIKAYSAVPPYVWENYKQFEINGLPEQITLDSKSKGLKADWVAIRKGLEKLREDRIKG